MKTQFETWTLCQPDGTVETVRLPVWVHFGESKSLPHTLKFLQLKKRQSLYVEDRQAFIRGPAVCMLDNGKFYTVPAAPVNDREAYAFWRQYVQPFTRAA